jgi:hypothetical protein
MSGSNQSIYLTDIARAKLKRFSDQLNVSRSGLIEFLIDELELMTVDKFEKQKRLLELDSWLMEKYFGKWSVPSTNLNWQSILNNLRGE